MVRGRRGGRRCGARGGGVMPPVASMPEGSNPQGEEQVIGQEQVVVGDVVGLMRSFQRMSEALINRLDRDEARVPVPNEGSQCAPAGSGSIHRELEKVKFPEFMGATDGSATEAWLENMAMCFALRDYTSNMKVCMVVFQLKGSALLWWKMLLPQLNMVVEDVSWELFEERFGRGICQRNSLSANSMSSMPYDRVVVWCQSMRPDLWSYLGMLHI
jgi:hypothetical protein